VTNVIVFIYNVTLSKKDGIPVFFNFDEIYEIPVIGCAVSLIAFRKKIIGVVIMIYIIETLSITMNDLNPTLFTY